MLQAEAFLTTRHENETAYLGEKLGRLLDQPLVIALEGDLGAGKTVFVRGAARGLAATDPVASPTFVLMKIYQGRLPLYHFDLYRLKDADELEELGFEEYLPGDGIACVEWAERFPVLLPQEYLQIKIDRYYDLKGEGRRITFTPHGDLAANLVDQIIESLVWSADGSLYLPPSAHGEEQREEGCS